MTNLFEDVGIAVSEGMGSFFQSAGVGLQKRVSTLFKRCDSQIFHQDNLKYKKRVVNWEYLGINLQTKKKIELKEFNSTKHTFITGASGFGKTVLLQILQEESLYRNKPVIFFDPKADFRSRSEFKELCDYYSRDYYIFDPNDSESIRLNPLRSGSVNQIVDRIMSSFDWSEEYYRSKCDMALTQTIKELKETDKIVDVHSVYKLLCEKYSSKETASIESKLFKIIESDFGDYLSDDGTAKTMKEIREEKSGLYLGLATQGYTSTAKGIARIFLGELMYNSFYSSSLLTSREYLKLPAISVYFDEFGALAMPEFIDLLNKCRSSKIELTFATQSDADLELFGDAFKKQLIENTANIFVLKQRVDDSASFFSSIFGTKESTKSTSQYENGSESGRSSVRETHEFIIHPDLIKNLGPGQCVLLEQARNHQISVVQLRDNIKRVEMMRAHKQIIIKWLKENYGKNYEEAYMREKFPKEFEKVKEIENVNKGKKL